jgi:type IV pilus assembly protein PilE
MYRRSVSQTGFTLIELMIVVVIVAIIASVAYPAYTRQVQNTHQQTAQGEMMAALASAEAWRAQRFSYDGFALTGAMTTSDRYDFNVVLGANNQSMVINALPKGAQAGAGAMAINNQGQTCLDKGNDGGCVIGTSDPWK